MDFFRSLSWTRSNSAEYVPVTSEDIMTKSATYKIIRGVFTSPISSDTEEEEDKPVEKKRQKKGKKRKKKKQESESESEEEEIAFENGAPCSSLTAAQHVSYVNLLLATKKNITVKLPRGFIEMKETVEAEQNKFLEYIHAKWQSAFEKHHILQEGVNRYMSDIWRIRLSCITSYPRFYKDHKMIPLVYASENPNFEMSPLKVLLEMGVVPKLHLPKENAVATICTDYAKMSLMAAARANDSRIVHQIPVSKDKNAELFALRHKAHIVISSSALKCIASNVRPYEKEWQIPVVVKEYCVQDGDSYTFQKIVFIDKKVAPKTMTAAEKNAWYHKLAVKSLMCNVHDVDAFRYPEREIYENVWVPNSESSPGEHLCADCQSFINGEKTKENENQYDSDAESDFLVIDENSITNSPFRSPDVRQLSNKYNMCICEKKLRLLFKDADSFLIKIDRNKEYHIGASPVSKTNVTYRLWKLYSEKRCKEELSANFLKHQNPHQDITVLIRCKMDACEREGEKIMPVNLCSKLEYQAEHGAEKVNLPSLIKEWTSLLIRPEAVLARVRINAVNEEVMMTEHAVIQELSKYASGEYNYSMRPHVLGSLYSVFSNLISEKPGAYLLQHNSRSGTFVRILQHTNKNDFIYDLHEDYSSANPEATEKTGIPSWIPIDSSILLPSFIKSKQIPATFKPRKLKGPGSNTRGKVNSCSDP